MEGLGFGIFEFKGTEYALTMDALVMDKVDDNQYFASCVDADGKEFIMYWEIINFDVDDESNSCDWDSPVNVEEI